jgi:DNA polymerase III sliding clamp (beta) subunit (PCNA family)
MKEIEVKREEALRRFDIAMCAVETKRCLIQSDSFVFYKGNLITFNGEMRTIQTSPFGDEIEGSILAQDLHAVFKKFSDENLLISAGDGELLVSGEKRKAGVKMDQDILMPFKTVHRAKEYKPLLPELMDYLVQASLVCSKDESANWEMTHVHADAEFVDATDRHRYFRASLATGLDKPLLIQAKLVQVLSKFKLVEIDATTTEGWVHFRTAENFEISLIMNKSGYFNRTMLDNLLVLPDAKNVQLPENLEEILARAEIMSDKENQSVEITLKEGEVSVFSKKAFGWFRETQKVDYIGPDFSFSINPAFLRGMLKKTKEMLVNDFLAKVSVDGTHFVAALIKKVV